MLFHMKDHKAAVLENDLNKLQKDGPAAWADLPEDELFTPAGFSEEQAEATASSNYSYWGSTFRAFFKNKLAVALLAALAAGDLPGVARRMYNVFEKVLPERQEVRVAEIKHTLIQCGALGATMSGTGPTAFGLFQRKELAEEACALLSEQNRDTFLAETV